MMLAGSILTLLGAVFLFLGALGMLRMPDVYNRMQAGTKATTLGTLLFLAGIALRQSHGACTLRLAVLAVFVLLTNPISSHALARAAHFIGVPLSERTVQDDLAGEESS